MSYPGEKLKETMAAVVPVTLIVLVLQLIFSPLTATETYRFIFSAVMLIAGLSLFLLGVDMSITPMGEALGKGIISTGKMLPVVTGGLVLGFLISAAEPDLLILAGNVDEVSGGALKKFVLVVVVSIGVAILIATSFVRIIKQIKLSTVLLIVYGAIFLAALFCPAAYMAIAFDSSGATTGAITVPFIMALAIGIGSVSHSKDKEGEDSFGVVGLASAGAIITVLIYGAVAGGGELQQGAEEIAEVTGIFAPFFNNLGHIAKESIISLAPISIIFFIFNARKKAISGRNMRRVVFGLLFSLIGLTIFFSAANAGFMGTGRIVGAHMVQHGNFALAAVGFLFGLTTILAEPAVHVLTANIEEQTAGHLPRKLILSFLSAGVAVAVMLAMFRIFISELQLWHILLPGYIIAMIMLFYTPPLFIGIAFDSGGVASGPMTATFILSFAQGAAYAHPAADMINDGFGIIALVAMSPLIMLQLLGIIYKHKTAKQGEEIKNEG